jgi:putative tryptophan/tyrosine transport system substrate-binding protein
LVLAYDLAGRIAVRRRAFIAALGSAAAWPLAARAQQGERLRRVGVLQGGIDTDDPRSQPPVAAFQQALQQLGWTDRNVKIDYRWPAGDADKARKYAAELLALAPDVIVAMSAVYLAPLLQATRTVPIVFVWVADPVGAGYVDSLSRPGGNATGFVLFDYSLSTKWLELLKEIAPGDPSGSRNLFRDRSMGRDPIRGAVAWGGGEPGQRAGRA